MSTNNRIVRKVNNLREEDGDTNFNNNEKPEFIINTINTII